MTEKLNKKASKKPSTPVQKPTPENRDNSGRFVPGKSGNPAGRPKKLPITEAIRQELEKKGRFNVANDVAIARKLIALALDGDLEAIREIADRAEGKSRQRNEVSGPEGGPIQFEAPGTREELERRFAELLNKGKGLK